MSLRIPVDGLVDILGEPTPITILRYGAPVINVLGDVTHGAPTPIEAAAVVHQATRRQLERAGLDMHTDARAFYSRTELRTATADRAPDVVQWDGRSWEIVNIADYAALGGLYLALGSLQP